MKSFFATGKYAEFPKVEYALKTCNSRELTILQTPLSKSRKLMINCYLEIFEKQANIVQILQNTSYISYFLIDFLKFSKFTNSTQQTQTMFCMTKISTSNIENMLYLNNFDHSF